MEAAIRTPRRPSPASSVPCPPQRCPPPPPLPRSSSTTKGQILGLGRRRRRKRRAPKPRGARSPRHAKDQQQPSPRRAHSATPRAPHAGRASPWREAARRRSRPPACGGPKRCPRRSTAPALVSQPPRRCRQCPAPRPPRRRPRRCPRMPAWLCEHRGMPRPPPEPVGQNHCSDPVAPGAGQGTRCRCKVSRSGGRLHPRRGRPGPPTRARLGWRASAEAAPDGPGGRLLRRQQLKQQ
mmetsp:Transcript_146801/g.471324  ORF Transcript_146801/g.471324 Transcript_146801/m.471324 type:complete len:238 (+) Transcript_146801:1319-2032(+)